MHLLSCDFKDGNTCGYSNSTHDIAYWTLDQSVSLSNTGTIYIYIYTLLKMTRFTRMDFSEQCRIECKA